MPEGHLVQPLVNLGIEEVELGEFFGLPQNNKFIPHLELRQI
jgi:hypothetical protein